MKFNLLSIFAIALVAGEFTDLVPNSMSSYEQGNSVQQGSSFTQSNSFHQSKRSGKISRSNVKHGIGYKLESLISEYQQYVKVHSDDNILGFLIQIAVSEEEAENMLNYYYDNMASFEEDFETYLKFVYQNFSFQLKSEFRSKATKSSSGGASVSSYTSRSPTTDLTKIELELEESSGYGGFFDAEAFFRKIVSGDSEVKKINRKFNEFKYSHSSSDIKDFLQNIVSENNLHPTIKFAARFNCNSGSSGSYNVNTTPGGKSGGRKVTQSNQDYGHKYSSRKFDYEFSQAEAAYDEFVAKYGSDRFSHFIKMIASKSEATRINAEFTRYIRNNPDDIVGFLRYIISTGKLHLNFNINLDQEDTPSYSEYDHVSYGHDDEYFKPSTSTSKIFRKAETVVKRYTEVYHQDFTVLFQKIVPKREFKAINQMYMEFTNDGQGDILDFIKFLIESKKFHLNFDITIPTRKEVKLVTSDYAGGRSKASVSRGLKIKVDRLVQGYEAYLEAHGDAEIEGFFGMIAITPQDAGEMMNEYEIYVDEHGEDNIRGFFTAIAKTYTFKSKWSTSSTKSTSNFSGSSSSTEAGLQKLINDFSVYIQNNGADNLEGFFSNIGASQSDCKKITKTYQKFQNKHGVNDIGGFFNKLIASNSFSLKWEYSSKSSRSTTSKVSSLPQSVVKSIDTLVEEAKVNNPPASGYAESSYIS